MSMDIKVGDRVKAVHGANTVTGTVQYAKDDRYNIHTDSGATATGIDAAVWDIDVIPAPTTEPGVYQDVLGQRWVFASYFETMMAFCPALGSTPKELTAYGPLKKVSS